MNINAIKELCRETLNSKTIEDICECKSYCILKEIIMRVGLSEKVLKEFKCIEKLKYIKSEELGRDIGWKNTFYIWENEGYAEKFDKIYNNEMNHNEIWKQMLEMFKVPEPLNDPSYYIS